MYTGDDETNRFISAVAKQQPSKSTDRGNEKVGATVQGYNLFGSQSIKRYNCLFRDIPTTATHIMQTTGAPAVFLFRLQADN